MNHRNLIFYLLLLVLFFNCYQMPRNYQQSETYSRRKYISKPAINSAEIPHEKHELSDKMKLLVEIRSFIGTPYQAGGINREGVDCSGFVTAVYQSAIGLKLPHSSKALYKQGNSVNRHKLEFGDLLFFRTGRTGKISHVGIFLKDDKFVHASSSKGVIVSDLIDNQYYKTRFVGARRITEL
ncbi:C40 family peptidase [candidate division KSB1 bacterium]|nr:C40 family peptidase [candidate division KSB1 bacterium]